jgi:hypothetical protein
MLIYIKITPRITLGGYFVYSGQSGHLFRFKPDTDRSEATLAAHYTSLWPE